MRSLLFTVAALALASQVGGETVDGKDFTIAMEDGVIVLDDENFDEALKLYDVLVVKFYAPWCGHCQKLAPEYEKIAKQLLSDDLPTGIAKMDVTKNERIGERYKVESFPTIKIFTNNERTAAVEKIKPDPREILKEAREMRANTELKLPFPEVSTAAEVKELRKKHSVVIAGAFASRDSKDYQAFAKVGTYNSFRQHVKFVSLVCDEAEAKKLAVAQPSVTLFKTFDQKRQDVPAPYLRTMDALADYVLINSRPLICDFTLAYKSDCASRENSPVVIGLYKPSLHKRFAAEFLKAAVQMRRSKKQLQFGFVDPGHPAFESYWESIPEEAPHMAFLHVGGFFKNGATKFHLPKQDYPKLDSAQILDLGNKFLNKEIKPSLMSSKPKWRETDDVKTVVGDDFDKRVLNSKNKDVFLMFYAPWCAMCKKAKPYFNELGRIFKDIPTVEMAQLEATSNDVYHEDIFIEGYPTLYWFKSDQYPKFPNRTESGPMLTDIKKLTQFVVENSHVEIDEDLILEPDEDMLEEAAEEASEDQKMKPDAAGASQAAVDDSAMDLKIISRDNFQERVLDSDAPAFIEFYAPWCGHCKTLMPKMEALAVKINKNGGKELIGKCDMTANDMDEWSLPMEGFPTLIYFPAEDKSDYTVYKGPRYVDDFELFLDGGYKQGAGGKKLKSADPVDDSNDAVKTIVASSFNERVMSTDTPAMLKFYAPWCGACKALAPHYEKVAETFKEKVLIGKFDATANDIDHPKIELSGYPLVLFFPGDDKRNPIKYEGTRSEEALGAFVKEQLEAEEEDVGEDDL